MRRRPGWLFVAWLCPAGGGVSVVQACIVAAVLLAAGVTGLVEWWRA